MKMGNLPSINPEQGYFPGMPGLPGIPGMNEVNKKNDTNNFNSTIYAMNNYDEWI